MTSKILTVSLVAFLMAGCANNTPTGPSTSSGPQPNTGKLIPVASVVRIGGDFIPRRLVAVSITTPTDKTLLHGADALAPKKQYTIDQVAKPMIARDMRRIMKGTEPAAYTFPVDNPIGARVVVHPMDPSLPLPSVHLVDAVTGVQLDRARDITVGSVNSRHTPLLPQPGTTTPQDSKSGPAPARISGLIALEPGFVQNIPKMRMLTFDRPTQPGQVRVVVPSNLQADGVWVEVQQPNSHITLAGVASDLNYGFGDTAKVTATVLYDDAPINGATVEGYIELPDHSNGGNLTFTSAGDGKYVANVPLASADWKYIGMWDVHIHATGASNGEQFERNTQAAFGYYPAHARIVALGEPVVTRGADGLIDDVSVAADIKTLESDRFSLGGVLTFTAPDGTEHAIASAQTGQFVNTGTGTITLHFDAASLAFARMNGPFHVRDITLVSQAGGITQERIGRGLGLKTPPILAKEIRFPKVVPLQVQDLIAHGDLQPIAKK